MKIKMSVSNDFFILLERLEGIRLKAYLDTGGVATIGIGTIRYPNGKKVRMGDSCTREQAYEYCRFDVKRFIDCVNENVKVQLTQNQFNALVSFCYNIGDVGFEGSTMLKLLNMSKFKEASLQFARWNKDNGKVVNGLVNRRKAEMNLFLTK